MSAVSPSASSPRAASTSAARLSPFRVVRDPGLVRDVLHRPGDFSPANALVAVTPLTGSSLRVLQRARFALPPILASNDTDSHAGVRKVVAGFFTPATVAAIEPRIRELARESARTAAARLSQPAGALEGRVDLVDTVAALPPAVLMLELLGLDVPADELGALKAWSRESLELFWGWPDPERQLELARSAAAFYDWLRDLVRRSVAARSRNLFAALDEHGLTTPEICSLGYFLLIAGQETTTQLISSVLFRALEGSCPVTWAEACDPARAREAVRHVLATESSVPTWRRVTPRETTLGGETIPAGAEILLELTGNHGVGGPGRPTDYGLAFGSGIHRCLGAKLAELEAAVVVQETAAALPRIRLADASPEWLRLLSFQAPRAVTVKGPTGDS
ncbi:cytochrome P450 [Sinomonas sp. ASV322]|uniref:cytochrome P450 n=1 Tax=Sinomonas sp. ASV322 TaxID=3041920 RepID=UPI0027DC6062|nr:cytochrome P450 [Sinomonas sp. ASV322]MDQ4504379.1 cytochrome P450 [Sinomonas sp. ASV322]